MAEEISRGLSAELDGRTTVKRPRTDGIVELLLRQLADEVVRQMEADSQEIATVDDLETRLDKLEAKLEALNAGEDGDDDDDDDDDGSRSSFPNLKYAKPKYKDVESVLRYVEGDDDSGGVKLVIMNFND